MYKKIKIVLDIIKKVWYKVVIPKGKMCESVKLKGL